MSTWLWKCKSRPLREEARWEFQESKKKANLPKPKSPGISISFLKKQNFHTPWDKLCTWISVKYPEVGLKNKGKYPTQGSSKNHNCSKSVGTYFISCLPLYLAKLTLMVVRGLLYLSKLAIMRKAIGMIRLMPETTKGRSNFPNTSFWSWW